MQNSLGCLCLRVQTGIPFRPERKKRPLYIIPTHLWAVANRPLPCNVGGFGIPFSNKKGTIFRTGKPVPNSALLATNIASIGGAGVRYGEDGGDVFFARDGLGCDGVALLFSCVCCVGRNCEWQHGDALSGRHRAQHPCASPCRQCRTPELTRSPHRPSGMPLGSTSSSAPKRLPV